MDYRNAAGRNWARSRPKRRAVNLGSGGPPMRLPETLPPTGRLEHPEAAGRNWTRGRPPRRPVELSAPPRLRMPLRERGGGDHDVPYRYGPPSAAWTFPFTAAQFGRLLVLRGRVRDGELTEDCHASVADR